MPYTYEVFIIGPMGKDKDKLPSDDDIAEQPKLSEHIENLYSAAQDVLPLVVGDEIEVDVYSPHDGESDIETYVFNRIDSADLAIADITMRSPSVMYELAFFHALGTPVIVVDDGSVIDAKRPFYLTGANILTVDNFTVEELKAKLEPRLRRFFDPEDDQDFSANPLSKFYRAPLVEAAGAAAVGRGYFYNMIMAILGADAGVVARYTEEAGTIFKVIKPSPSFTVNQDLKRFGEIAAKWNGGNKLEEQKWDISARGRERIVSAYKIESTIYDYPRTIGSLERSPRYNRAGAKRPGNKGVVSPERLQAARDRVAGQLVHFFQEYLDSEIETNSGMIFRDQLDFITLDEFEAEVDALIASRA